MFVPTDGHAPWKALFTMKAGSDEIGGLKAPAGLPPTHGDSQIGAQNRNRAAPTGSFPQKFHVALSTAVTGACQAECNPQKPAVLANYWTMNHFSSIAFF